MKTWSFVLLMSMGVVGMAGCGSTVVEGSSTQGASNSGGNGGSGATGGSGGAGGSGASGGSGGGDACSALLAEPAQAVTLNIVNKTGASVFIYDECYEGGLDAIAIDNHHVLNDFYGNGCDELVACKTVIGDCFGNSDYELKAGDTYTHSWDGDFFADEETTVPEGCKKNCMVFGFCHERVAAKAGSHTLEVEYSAAPNGAKKKASVTFELPATEVTLTLE